MFDCNVCDHCKVQLITLKEYQNLLVNLHGADKPTKRKFGGNLRKVAWCSQGNWRKPYFVSDDKQYGNVFEDEFGIVRVKRTVMPTTCNSFGGEDGGGSTDGDESS